MGTWRVEYLVSPEREADGGPPPSAAEAVFTVEADGRQEALTAARILVMREYPDEVKWEREAYPFPGRPRPSTEDEAWAAGVITPSGGPAWPLPWQRGTDRYHSWCADCLGEARVYDGHIVGYDHKEGCPNR